VGGHRRQGRAHRGRYGGFCARFERQVDPDGLLEPEQRAEMARHARMAYMLQLAERSAASRRRRSTIQPDRRHRRADPG